MMDAKLRKIGIDRLKALLAYDPETGALTHSGSNREASHIQRDGYRYVGMDNKKHLAHRICWLLATGAFPARAIDHINGDKADNRLSNLRLASIAENNRNRPKQSNNTSGFKGVSFDRANGKFRARITADGKRLSLGFYNDANEAANAYAKASAELHKEYAQW